MLLRDRHPLVLFLAPGARLVLLLKRQEGERAGGLVFQQRLTKLLPHPEGLALGILAALRSRELLEFDAVVPIPLSPDKLRRGSFVERWSSRINSGSIWESLQGNGSHCRSPSRNDECRLQVSVQASRARYSLVLQVNAALSRVQRVLLVDDTIARGWTLACTIQKIRQAAPDVQVVAASAGQMILKEHVLDERQVLA